MGLCGQMNLHPRVGHDLRDRFITEKIRWGGLEKIRGAARKKGVGQAEPHRIIKRWAAIAFDKF